MPFRNNTAFDSAVYWLQNNVRGARPFVRARARSSPGMYMRRRSNSRYYGRRGGYTVGSRQKPGWKSRKQLRRTRRRRAYYRRKASKKRTWSKRGLIKYVKAKLHVENKRRTISDADYAAASSTLAYMIGNGSTYTMTRDDVKTNAMWSFGVDATPSAVPIFQLIQEGSGSGNRIGQEIFVKHISLWMRVKMLTPCDPYPQHFRLLLMRQESDTPMAFEEVYKPNIRTLNAKYLPYENRAEGNKFKALWSRDYTFAPGPILGCSVNPDGDDVADNVVGVQKWYRIKIPVNRRVRYKPGSTVESDGWHTLLYMNQINHEYSAAALATSNYLHFKVLEGWIHYTDV